MPILRLTDAPSSSANVLYDFNPSPDQFAGHEGLSWGAPEWTAAPGSVGGFDGPRTVAFNHYMSGGLIGAYSELADLARALLRPDAWLLVQVTSLSEPRWFHVWRSSPAELTPENLFVRSGMPAGLHGINVSLTADPYLYGERVSLPSVTIDNDPTAALHPMSCVLDSIVGDAPAPLRYGVANSPGHSVDMVVASTAGVDGSTPALRVIDVGTGDEWTAQADTGAPVADASMVGGSYRATTFADNAMQRRLLGADIFTGRWLAVARLAASVASVGLDVKIHLETSAGASTDDVTVQIPAGAGPWWQVLGEIDRGIPNAPTDTGVVDGSGTLQVYAQAVSGAPELRWDCLLLVPIGPLSGECVAHVMTETNVVAVGGDVNAWTDGDAQTHWEVVSVSGTDVSTFDLGRVQSGSFPVVVPGVPNLLTLIVTPGANSGGSDDITMTTDLDLSYRPRFLWPAP
ncbi:hypothetical protein [Nocardioides terrisoli]|uniref:hypothetical protein n=1 Tax=Nocardioides terrisoli TaxID=3388267 RepID=UPI00287B5D43|nr:hypothetical protein [Nocardioides marmorisolisilvae]